LLFPFSVFCDKNATSDVENVTNQLWRISATKNGAAVSRSAIQTVL
jgi:hypothetical protein